MSEAQSKPSLENLRKRAKQILRWHRDGVWTVAETIRSTLPRFAHSSDAEIMKGAFRLGDAQEMIARQNGFDDWRALKAGYETMSMQSQEPAAQSAQPTYLLNATPMLFVKDIHASCDFFEDVLGFRTMFKYGAPPFYAQVSRDSVIVALRCVDEPLSDPALVAREDFFSAIISVGALRELKQLFAEFTEAGADFHQALKRQPYGVHDFVVRDPDGNLVDFMCGD
jgi:catechol 2,3-dioxygenase-like lactoylglutathione lyase family enzyme